MWSSAHIIFIMEQLDSPAHIEKLVQRFYQPGRPQEIKKIEDQIQTFQFSNQGWQLADTLLYSEDRNVRFFGALTFTIKIKRDSASLTESEARSLVERLLQHLIRLVNRGESALVIKKLCSALVAYYLLPSTLWSRPVFNVMVSLSQRQGFDISGLSTLDLAQSLSNHQLLAALWFSMGLAEEAKQALVVNEQSLRYDMRVAANTEDVASLLYASIDIRIPQDGIGIQRIQEALKCSQSWIMYAQRVWMDQGPTLRPLQSLFPLFLRALEQDELYEQASELLVDILSNFSIFLTENDYGSLAKLLTTPKVGNLFNEIISGDHSPEATSYARVCLAYGEAAVQDLARRDDVNLAQLLFQLMQLLSHEGYPGVEDDDFCSQALVFWQIYAEYITDSLYTLEPDQMPPWMHAAQGRLLQVIDTCWAKIRQPPEDIALRWDSEDRTNFQSFRNDVEDFLQTSQTVLGMKIFEKFAWLVLKSLEEQAWHQLEASIFCLEALSEVVSEDNYVDVVLSNLFGSAIFSEMTGRKDEIPAKTRQATVSMITRFIGFFERHKEHLPAMLNFLFHSLRVPDLGNVAAKAIFTVCSSCRTSLISELEVFIKQYEAIQKENTLESSVKENVLAGIAAIIQTLPTDAGKLEPLRTLLGFIEFDLASTFANMRAVQHTPADSEEYQTTGLCTLKSLASMGKALRAPDDAVIDLEVEVPTSGFWTSDGEGSALQALVIEIVETLTSSMYWNSEIVEAACQVLRSGFRETTPGLFVFPPQTTVKFFLSSSMTTSRLDLIISTAAAMLSCRSSSSTGMLEAASTCISHAIHLIATLDHNPSVDPEVAASIIDLADKCIPSYLLSMRHLESINDLLRFTISSLSSSEIMPLRSAAHFWSVFVQKYDLSEEVAQFQYHVMQTYGPTICVILIHGIAGEVPRSNLETLAESLKKLIFAQPQAKQWISAALEHPNFPSKKITAAQKRIWLQKVMNLRGARKTNNEVKDFWVLCRGPESNFAF